MSASAIQSGSLKSFEGNRSDSPSAAFNGKEVKKLPSPSSTLPSNSGSSAPLSPAKVQKVEKAFLKRFSTGQRIALFTTFALIALTCAFLIFFCPPVGVFTLGLVPTYWGSIAAMLWISSSLSGKKVTSWIQDQFKDEKTNQEKPKLITDSKKDRSEKSSSEGASLSNVDEPNDDEEKKISEPPVDDSDVDETKKELSSDKDGLIQFESSKEEQKQQGLRPSDSDLGKSFSEGEFLSNVDEPNDDEEKKISEPSVDDSDVDKTEKELSPPNSENKNEESRGPSINGNDFEEEDLGLAGLFKEDDSSTNHEEAIQLISPREIKKRDPKPFDDLIGLGQDLIQANKTPTEVFSKILEEMEDEMPLEREAIKISQATVTHLVSKAPQRAIHISISKDAPIDLKIQAPLKPVPPMEDFLINSSASQAPVSLSSEMLLDEETPIQAPDQKLEPSLDDQVNTPTIVPQEKTEIIPMGLFEKESKDLKEITKVDGIIEEGKTMLAEAKKQGNKKRIKEIETDLDIAAEYRRAIINHRQVLKDKEKVLSELKVLKDAKASRQVILEKTRELRATEEREIEAYDDRHTKCRKWLDTALCKQLGNRTIDRRYQSRIAGNAKG